MEIKLDLATDGDTISLVLGAWSLVHDVRSGRMPSTDQMADDLRALLISWEKSARVDDPACVQLIQRIKQLQGEIEDGRR